MFTDGGEAGVVTSIIPKPLCFRDLLCIKIFFNKHHSLRLTLDFLESSIWVTGD